MDANQLIAYNLGRARQEWHETQEQSAQRLWEYIGEKWSKATFSSAERSALPDSGRRREFSANEILAFSQVFRKPISWFFTPPEVLDEVTCGPDAWHPVARPRLLAAINPPDDFELRQLGKELQRIGSRIEEKGGTPNA